MRTRVTRTVFGANTIIEGYLINGYNSEKLIIEKGTCPEHWMDEALNYDEGTEEYYVDGMWLSELELESFVRNCDGG